MEKHQRTNEEEEEKCGIIQCAELILPWLHPTELASISSTCKTLYHISKTLTISRSTDASRSMEPLPIPFLNSIDHHPYSFFLYTPSQTLHSHPQPWPSNPNPNPRFSFNWVYQDFENQCGCDCVNCEVEVGYGGFGCPCSGFRSPEVVVECGPGCRCGVECGNRLSQRGVLVGLKIVKDVRKGWGLHAVHAIAKGQFVCEYAGELLTTTEARKRQQMYDELASRGGFSSALLVVREHLPSGKACLRMNIDATRVGNVARFINHSCDGGNLSTVLVRSSGALLPRLCFFASRDIKENEELSFSYGDTRVRPKVLKCFCGSSSCFGVLPSEHT